MIAWAQALPINQSWTAQIDAKISPSFNTGVTGGFGSGKYLEAIFAVVSDLTVFKYQFGNILHRDNNTDISYYFTNVGFQNYTQVDTPTTISDLILKFDYNSQTKTIKAQYADYNTPNIFYDNYSFDITPYTDIGSLYIAAGGFSYGISVPTDIIIMDNIAIIPEPTALSLVAFGLGVVLRRRRRTV